MPSKAVAFQGWLSSFGMPAYAASSVPDDAALPYATYDLADGCILDGEVNQTVNLWFRTESETVPNAKAAELGRALGMGGVILPCDGGAMWVKRGSGEAGGKRRYLNIDIEYITAS